MNLPFLASFIALILIISMNIKWQTNMKKKQDREFWEREKRANSVRKKPLDQLHYIQIPLETFPTHLMHDNEDVMECIHIVESLTSRKIVNFTGYSNTDLKLEYGTANITELSEYDQNFTVLVRTLQKWADLLISSGYPDEAAILMEYAVLIGTDITRTYFELAEYKVSRGEVLYVDHLINLAGNLRSLNKEPIIRKLREKYPDVF